MGIVHAKVDRLGLFQDDSEADEDVTLIKPNITITGVKARVDRVHVDGLHRTKDDVVMGTVGDLFNATDFEDVIVRAHKAREALDNLGCFRNVCVFIDVSSGPDATPDGLEVTFQVREMSRMVGGVNATVGEDEGSLVLGVKLPNLWGRGESAQAAYSVGYRNSCSFNVTASKPLPLKPFDPVISTSLYQQNHSYPWSGYHLLDRGVLFNLGFRTSPTTKHSVQWEGLVRDMTVLDNNKTSFKVRESSGPQLKSTLRHIINMDHRDDSIFPARGSLAQLSSELSGLGGNVANFKSELRMETNHTLSEEFGVILQLSGALGFLHDIQGTTLVDHFFLGGPTSLRGFKQRGVGPHMDGQSVGGRMYWASGLHLFTPLPLPGSQAGLLKLFRSHFFLNAGCLAFPERSQAQDPSLSTLLGDARVSCGAGVCVRLGRAARLELNYVVPLRTMARDVPAAGVQFGVGACFL